jgi:hypothetical protein
MTLKSLAQMIMYMYVKVVVAKTRFRGNVKLLASCDDDDDDDDEVTNPKKIKDSKYIPTYGVCVLPSGFLYQILLLQ